MSQAEVGEWEAKKPSRARFPRSTRYLLGALVVVAGMVVLWMVLAGPANPEVQRLPERERQELYRRTLEDLRLCATGSGALMPAHCAHQAALAQDFPECDAACRDLALRWESRPTR